MMAAAPPDQFEFIQVMAEVARLVEEAIDIDTMSGTLRPEGPSRGAQYERIGMFLTAMYRAKAHPMRMLQFIQHMAEMPESEAAHAALMSSLLAEGLPEGAVFIGPKGDA